MNKKIVAVALTLLMALGILGAVEGTPPRAHADTKVCTTVALMPKSVVRGTKVLVKGTGRAFCVGWGNTSRYEMNTRVEVRVGAPGSYRWVPARHFSSSKGDKLMDFYTINPARAQRWRTRAQLTIRASNGVVIKRYGWDQSAAIYL